MSRTRYEWTLVDFAIWFAGAVTVPIYETSSAEQVAVDPERLRRGRLPRRDRRSTRAVVDEVRGDLPTLDAGLDHRRPAALDDLSRPPATVDRRGARGPAHQRRRPTTWRRSSTPRARRDGPKGCELTHRNFLVEVGNVVSAKAPTHAVDVFQDDGASTLLFLPLAHVFARIIEVGVRHGPGAELGHTADIKNLIADLAHVPADVHPVGAARLREGLQLGRAEGRGRRQGQDLPRRGRHGHRLQRGAGRTAGPGLGLKAKHAMFDKLVYGKLRAALGGQVQLGGLRRRAARQRGSATSSAASASRSSRATASPRRQPPSR